MKELKKGNEWMEQINKDKHNEIIEENANNLLVQKKKNKQKQNMLEKWIYILVMTD